MTSNRFKPTGKKVFDRIMAGLQEAKAASPMWADLAYENIFNVSERHCKIGRVTMKRRNPLPETKEGKRNVVIQKRRVWTRKDSVDAVENMLNGGVPGLR